MRKTDNRSEFIVVIVIDSVGGNLRSGLVDEDFDLVGVVDSDHTFEVVHRERQHPVRWEKAH